MSSQTVLPPPGCATASTRRRSTSKRSRRKSEAVAPISFLLRETTMKHPMVRWSILPVGLLTGLSIDARSLAAPAERDTDRVFVGYLFGQPRNINFRLYTHL